MSRSVVRPPIIRSPFGPPFRNDLLTHYKSRAALWAPYYTLMEQQLGATATLVNFGDVDNFGAVGASTGTGMKFSATGLSPVWTPSEALNAFDTPINLTSPGGFQGLAPILPFNATDEEMDTPDADYWSRDDSGSQGFSVGAWVNVTNSAAARYILSKRTNTTGVTQREWAWLISDSDTLQLSLIDESAGVVASRPTDTAITQGSFIFLVTTYDGTGGATAANGITHYSNGAVKASTASNNGSYVAMENTTALVRLGFLQDASATSSFFNGKMLGGPWGPFWTTAVLTAAQVSNIYARMRLGLGV